jgi:two-component system CheB/CheR fusion protein
VKVAESTEEAQLKPAGAFPVVGIGASAGGLRAFEAFLSGIPPEVEPGMAFVMVQHLAPDHKSILTDLIRRYTKMQVFEVEDGMVVQPNCCYIIPPNHDMAFLNGSLQLLEPSLPRGQRLPIDFFFRSLALDQCEQAIGIILSGTGSDGTLGVRAIKGEGGMVMVQSCETTEYDGMPRSALATGLVDYELAPEAMAVQLLAYVKRRSERTLPRTDAPPTKTENTLNKIFVLLRSQSGHDFSQYKSSTIYRRIERRMAILQISTIEQYLKYLQHSTAEVGLLFRDLLIGVTSFFRDPEAFEALEESIIPVVCAGKPAGSVIRAWVPGCSTGEEAYSIAILLQEKLERMKQNYLIQVFATDIDSQAILAARAASYPSSIANDVTAERLARFFTLEQDGSSYRIHKQIRDLVVFSEQNLIRDPPFSKLDLISCRNLLIYMGGELQKKVIPIFHYALKPGGVLFLGTAETVGEFNNLFAALDRKSKVYERMDDVRGSLRTAAGHVSLAALSRDIAASSAFGKKTAPEKVSLRELTEKAILEEIAPIGALVNAQGAVLYLQGRTGMFLEPTPGEAVASNILKMAREGLRGELSAALHQAVSSGEVVRSSNVRVKTNSHFSLVNLSVHPVTPSAGKTGEPPLYLILLEEAPSPAPAEPPKRSRKATDSGELESRIATLTQELRAKDEYLASTTEELETSNEELKSSNEEMQSVNEELQSTNEELETSKEELQSVNEELATLNSELQIKISDLTRLNNDMNNLLAGTGIGTVFVDHQLRILRFTPGVNTIINLISTDVGRPVSHIASNLMNYNSLTADVRSVLQTLVPKQMDVRTHDGKWYSMRIQPYRTLENVIEGAVITFVEITDRQQNQLDESDKS